MTARAIALIAKTCSPGRAYAAFSASMIFAASKETKVTISKDGLYVLRLTAEDGQMQGSHTLAVRKGPDPDEGH